MFLLLFTFPQTLLSAKEREDGSEAEQQQQQTIITINSLEI